MTTPWRVKRERKPAPRGRLGAATGRLLAWRRTAEGREERVIPGRISGGYYSLRVAGPLAGRCLLAMTDWSDRTHWPTACRDAEDWIAEHGIEAMTTPASKRRPMRVPGLTFGQVETDSGVRIVRVWRGAEQIAVLESVENMAGDGWEPWTGADCDDHLDGLRSISEARLSDAKAEARREIADALAAPRRAA